MILQARDSIGVQTARPCISRSRSHTGGACTLLPNLWFCKHEFSNTKILRVNKHRSTSLRQPAHLWQPNLPSNGRSIFGSNRVVFASATQQITPHREDSSERNEATSFLNESPQSKGREVALKKGDIYPEVNADVSSDKHLIHSHLPEFVSIRSKRFRERLIGFKSWWVAVNEAYKEDLAMWGYGSSPIFKVYTGKTGRIEKVLIDEDEIKRREFVDLFIPGINNNENNEIAHKKIVLARSIANDLEQGKRDYNRYSSVFEVIHLSSEDNSQVVQGRELPKQFSIIVQHAPPFLKKSLAIAIPVYAICILFGAYLMTMNRSRRDSSYGEKSAARLEKLRNLRSRINASCSKADAGQPPLVQSDLMQKILEVREMARQVRSEEGLERQIDEISSDVEEDQEGTQDSQGMPVVLATGRIDGGKDESPNFGKKCQLDVQEFKGFANQDATSRDDVNISETNTKVTPKLHMKMRPRIITSIDEAMTVLESNKYEEKNTAQESKTMETYEGNDCKDHQLRQPCAENGTQEGQTIEIHEGDKPKDWMPGQLYAGNGLANASQTSSMLSKSQVEHFVDKRVLADTPEASVEKMSAKSTETVNMRNPVHNVEPDDIVGSGQPLGKMRGHVQPARKASIFSSTKQWSKELHRKYNLEQDPEIRDLMKEIGSDLDSWLTEEEIEETARLASKLQEVDDEDILRDYSKAQRKIKEEREKFGLNAVLEKYKEYQPKAADKLWWLDLPCVMCLMVANEEEHGLYGLNMNIDDDDDDDDGDNDDDDGNGYRRSQMARHIVAFEDRRDASNFCHLLEVKSKFDAAEVRPFSPKELLHACKKEGFQVTVLTSGQVQIHIDQTLEEIENRILEIGSSVYWDQLERDHSIDMDSLLYQRFGL
ncbi:hypothetical protein KP509_04G066300 [Ceratopteris richardii]|uniref:Uncharacterized protein n=1 Tax=Ceratopteris richardii TaxID=49495 RepID=A0A8T2V189_CERRI|nr:hypothetical protein KP509_04G066300 [Ceratopteris richardii]